jgi:hypothetical protein
MLVRGYVKTGARALWWHLPDEIYEEYNVKPGDPVTGTLLAVYNPDGEKTHSPNEHFEWSASKESGLAVLLPSEIITKYELTEFHFLEIDIVSAGNQKVYPGDEDRQSSKWWPKEKMKLEFRIGYIPPAP